MSPLYFGSPDRRLFGAFHEGSPGRAQSLGVLLCNPFGQEAIRTHRLFRVLAERLAQAGIHVLRFDFFGSGDSAGEDEQGELDGWRDDVLAAHAELQRRSGARASTWMGARLGATSAIRAAQFAPATPQHLVVWDPVLDGEAYRQWLRVKHVETIELAYGDPDPDWRRRLATDPGAFAGEAIGAAIAPLLRRQLEALRPEHLDVPAAVPVVVLADPDDHAVHAWVETQRRNGAAAESMALKRTFEWTSNDAAGYEALVPAEAVRQLVLAIDR
jgi:alpha/beta superfamily hydrolase